MTAPERPRPRAGQPAGPRVLLLVPARTYRAADFLLAAARMGLDLVVGSDGALPLGGRPVIPVNPGDPDASVRRILARSGPVAAVVAADTPMLVLAAAVAARMGLPHNPVEAVRNATDKARQRQRWAAAGVAQPQFEIVPAAAPRGRHPAGGRGGGVPVRGQGGLAQRQPGHPARRRPGRRRDRGPRGSGTSSPPPGALPRSPCWSRSTCPARS